MRLPLEQTAHHPAAARAAGALNIAHRGASAAMPENTLAAVRRAVEHDADLVEIDVRRTRDGALVLLHDVSLARTTDVQRVYPHRAPWRVADFTYDELGRLDAGSWKSARHAGERVPTLEDAMSAASSLGAGLQVELKSPRLYPGVVRDLAEVLAEAPQSCDRPAGVADIVVQSFDFAAMKELKARMPDLRVGLLGAPAREHLPVLGTWADQVNPHHRAVDQRYVDAVHAEDMQCCVWTVDHPAHMRRALRRGVDGVISNRPDRLATALDQLRAGSRAR